jgi:pyridoxine kinase
MRILSVQFHVAYGRVGNSIAVLALNCRGHEVWTVNTVQFSRRLGHGEYADRAFKSEQVAEILNRIAALGVYKIQCAS